MRKYLLANFLLLFLVGITIAQDIRFTQFYQAPIHLNPAFTGASGAARIGVNYRKQGNQDESIYETFSAFGDYYIKDIYASVGVLFLSDWDEFTGYTSRMIAVPISYDFTLSDLNITIKPAIQASYNQRGIDFSRFVFSDQFDNQGNMLGGTSEPLAVSDQITFYDAAAGVVTYSKSWWLGYSMHNLFQNNTSFVSGGESLLDIRYSIHGGASIDLNHDARSRTERYFMPTFSYVSQGGFNQLDIGALLHHEPILIGAVYRGVPNPLAVGDYSAISGVIGLRKFDFTIGYSYDLPINTVISPGGIHELSMTFLFDPTDPNATPRSSKRLKCPLPFNQFGR